MSYGNPLSTRYDFSIILQPTGNPFIVTSTGTIFGNSGAGLVAPAGTTDWTITNNGFIRGALGSYSGNRFQPGHTGYDGVSLAGSATLTNTGLIQGGYGGRGGIYSSGGNGGAGIVLTGQDTITNAGSIAGGHGGRGFVYAGKGGDGVVIDSGSNLSNTTTGRISGGNDNYGSLSAIGVLIQAGGALTNAGTIAGGAGNSSYGLLAGAGGTGVYVSAGSSFTNTGLLLGGNGGNPVVSGAKGASGGAGVEVAAGGTFTNAGTIIGGSAGGTGSYAGTAGDAVLFLDAGRLIVDSGAVFGGLVNGDGGVLELASSGTVGTLSGLQTSITGFASIVIDSGAAWVLAGNNTIGKTSTLSGAGALSATGTLANAGSISVLTTLGEYGVFSNAGNSSGGIVARYTATVANAGTITGSAFGVALRGGGSITNLAGGAIVNSNIGMQLGGGTFDNAGYISGVYAEGNTTITNRAQGTISNAHDGIEVGSNGTLTVDNDGTVAGGNGIQLDTGSVTNNAGGLIQASNGAGILAINGVTISNAGTIRSGTGQRVYGVSLSEGGVIDNAAGALIYGSGGISTRGNVTITNAGSIEGSTSANTYAMKLGAADNLVTNLAGGVISGRTGISGGSDSTIVNAGTIIGSAGVALRLGSNSVLTIDPGAVFSGSVVGGGSTSSLDLASGSSAGTLAGLGSAFTSFSHVTLESAAYWTLVGANTLASASTLTNAGTLVDSGTLTDSGKVANDGVILDSGLLTIGALAGTGAITIGSGATLVAGGSVASTQTIDFAGATGLLTIAPAFAAAVGGMQIAASATPSDAVDLAGVTDVMSTTIVNGTMVEAFSGADQTGTLLGSFVLAQDVPAGTFADWTSDDSGGTEMFLSDVTCFLAGTRIAMPGGFAAVEAVRAGDRVLTQSGTARPVRWIGHRRIDLARHPDPDRAVPIRIRVGAIAASQPSRDLFLSPDHAVLLDGMLVPIRLLVNGASILRDSRPRTVTYYHLELDTHDILLAENLAAESYLDTGNRGMFENGGGPLLLHPDLANDQARRVRGSCAPFVDDPRRIEPLWRYLAMRAVERGLRLPSPPPLTQDPALCMDADGKRIRPVRIAATRYAFILPLGTRTLRLVSRSVVPHMLRPWIEDRRCLGVMVSRLVLRAGDIVTPIPLDHPLLSDGWWDVEQDAARMWRWTTGDACIPLSLDTAIPVLQEAAGMVEVELGGASAYPVINAADPEQLALVA